MPFLWFHTIKVNWINRQFTGGDRAPPTQGRQLPLESLELVQRIPPATALRSILYEARGRKEEANLIDGRHVLPPHPAGAFLIISCFVLFWFLFCSLLFFYCFPSSTLRWNHAGRLQQPNIQKVICCLMGAALCTINSLQQRPETHILPSDSSHNRGKHNPAVWVITGYSRISLNLVLFKLMPPPKPLARYYPGCL